MAESIQVDLGAVSLNPRASDELEQVLQRMIMRLELPPGSTITVPQLAERLVCGRSPLRDALQRLQKDYLVKSDPGRTISIPGLDLVDLAQLEQAQLLVEPYAASMVASRHTARHVADLRAIVERAEACDLEGDLPVVADMDYEFHVVLAQATNNQFVADMMTRIHRLGTRFGYAAWRHEGRATQSWIEHRAIVDAIEASDAELARTRMEDHTRQSIDRIIGAIRAGSQR
jgi:DNA-binding GntR family transcriptional regulator